MKAHLRQIRISVNKANVVAGLIRGKNVDQALDILKFTPKKAADILYKVVASASANAQTNDSVSSDKLLIDEIIITRGSFWRRFLPSSRGRALPLRKPTCNISVHLSAK